MVNNTKIPFNDIEYCYKNIVTRIVKNTGILNIIEGEYCPSLCSLAVTDCRDVTESSLAKLRQRGVVVDRKLDPVLLRLARIRQENRQARVQI